MKNLKNISIVIVSLIVWIFVYISLQNISDWFVFKLLKLEKGAKLTDALGFFIFELPKVLMLLALIIFLVGIVRSYMSQERALKILGGKSELVGSILASFLGIITPFCSCSAIPLFLGFVETGIPLGVTFSFLISAPMINEVAVVLLFGMFGWQITLIYIITGLVIAIFSGWIIGKLKLEKWVQEWVYQIHAEHQDFTKGELSFSERITYGYDAVKDIVGKVWLYVAVGIVVGAGFHGYVPQNFLASFMGSHEWYSVPLSVLIGIPLYSNAAGIIPIVSVLIEKGASLGTALAFMMAVVGLSLPEIIILKKVLKWPLIATFVGIVGCGILIVGYLFNFIF